MKLDPLDSKIIELLVEDARLSLREIAAKTGSTTPTVSARLRNLHELGIVQGYRAQLNPDVLGGSLRILLLQTRPSAADRIAMALAADEAIERVEVVSGGRVLAYLRERPHHGVRVPHAILSKDADVVSYEVADVLATPRSAQVRLDPEGIEIPCHQCKGPIHGAPVRAKLEGRPHLFCCTHCMHTFRTRLKDIKSHAASAPARLSKPARHHHD